MRKPSDIIDYLPPLVEGVERRELEQRLKCLRAAGLYPAARRVGDRAAGGVSEEHCATLVLALICSFSAYEAAEGVERYRDLPLSAKAQSDQNLLWHVELLEGESGTLHQIIAGAIRASRKGLHPWEEGFELTAISAWLDGEPAGGLQFREEAKKVSKPDLAGVYYWFREEPEEEADEDGPSRVHRKRSCMIHGGIIGHMADFLGPIEPGEGGG